MRYHGDGSGNVVVDIGYYPGETRFDSRGDDANLLMDDEKGSWPRGGGGWLLIVVDSKRLEVNGLGFYALAFRCSTTLMHN